MNLVRKYPALSLLAAFLVGWFIGLVLFGWFIWPVEWTNATPAQLSPQYQQAWVKMVSDLYSFNGNAEMVQQALGGWSGDVTGDQVACSMAAGTAEITLHGESFELPLAPRPELLRSHRVELRRGR